MCHKASAAGVFFPLNIKKKKKKKKDDTKEKKEKMSFFFPPLRLKWFTEI